MPKYTRYSKVFELNEIALVVEQNYSQAKAARNLRLNPNILERLSKKADSKESAHSK